MISILYIFLALPSDGRPDIVKFLILSQVIFLLYLIILYLARKIDINIRDHKSLFLIIIILAIIARIGVTYIADEQTYLSDDVYRYVWEGKTLASGYSPYIISPDDMKHSNLADSSIYPKINHPYLPTIYPPLSQFLFVVAYLIDNDGINGFKILSFFFEIISLWLVLLFVKTARLPDWTYLIYLLSPLILIEFLLSNHLDILGLPFFLVALIFLLQSRPRSFVVGVFLALAILVKLYLLFFIPFIFFHFKGRDRVKFTISTLVTLILFYLPFILISGLDLFGSLGAYLTDWQYNGSIFLLFKQFLPITTARILCLIIFLLGSIVILFHSKLRSRVMLQMFSIFGLFVIVSPMIFNWYMVWLIPFIIYYRNLPFLILSGTAMVSYHVLIGYYDNGEWSEYVILKIWNYLPFYLILLYMVIKKIRQKQLSLL
jgi:hypothetical protein